MLFRSASATGWAPLERVASAVPLRRAGGAQPVADAVLFLLRQDFLTGAVLHVDGGEYL